MRARRTRPPQKPSPANALTPVSHSLSLTGMFGRGWVTSAQVSARVPIGTLPFLGHLVTIGVHGRVSAPSAGTQVCSKEPCRDPVSTPAKRAGLLVSIALIMESASPSMSATPSWSSASSPRSLLSSGCPPPTSGACTSRSSRMIPTGLGPAHYRRRGGHPINEPSSPTPSGYATSATSIAARPTPRSSISTADRLAHRR